MSEELSRFILSRSPRHRVWRVPARHSPSLTIMPAEDIVWLPQADTTRAQVESLWEKRKGERYVCVIAA